ncbi:hypothetical protein [Deinococcus sp. Arct2-2]|uniref:hypothetical protein n=1 Tax=Deinococcus sp. Arct2-2 TaxID=2568653 RepID=UPI00197AF2F1|nr:hypothetical protein [Deinococcus sp. Arct2-2]
MIRVQTQKVPPAITRTWAVVTVYRECGVITSVERDTVTLTRTAAGIEGTINGEPVEAIKAIRLLHGAHDLTVISEELEPATIGNATAANLHRRLARAGIPAKEHYGFATAALDKPVYSLALLTPEEHEVVLDFLAFTHPAPEAEAVAV